MNVAKWKWEIWTWFIRGLLLFNYEHVTNNLHVITMSNINGTCIINCDWRIVIIRMNGKDLIWHKREQVRAILMQV